MDLDPLRRTLSTDRVLRAVLGVYGAIVLLYAIPDSAVPGLEAFREQAAWYFWDGFLLILTIFAIQHRLKADHTDAGAHFWNTVSAALVFWFLGDSVQLIGALDESPTRINVLSDCLYSIYYLVLVLASRERPDSSEARSEKREDLQVWTSLLFVLAFLVYFSFIPAWKSVTSYNGWDQISFLLYICLDLYVAIRFAYLSGVCRTQKWQFVYRLFVLFAVLSAILSGLQNYSLSSASVIPNYHGTGWDLPWYLPFLLLTLTARWERRVPENLVIKAGTVRATPPAWEPIAFYAVTFPLVHLLLESIGLIEPITARPRQIIVIIYFVFFGTIALLHGWRREQRRLQAETRLRRSEEQFREMVENMREIILIESEGKLVFANSKALDKLGDERLMHGAAQAFDLEDHRFAAPNRVPVFKRLDKTRDGYLDLEITWNPIHFQGKEALQFAARDVTAMRRLHREAERLEHLAALGRFSSAMAHKIRNPLAAIVMQASYLSRRLEGESEYFEILGDLHTSVDRLQNLVSSVQSFIRPPKARVAAENIVDVIESSLMAIEWDTSKIQFHEDFKHQDGRIAIDIQLMQIVLGNIFNNSIRAMPDGGTLSIRTANQKGFLKLEIEDTGDGIAKEDLRRIFEPFFSRRDDGVGLGLSLVEQILSQHECRYMMESEPGSGAKFTIWFRTPALSSQEVRI